MHTCYWVMVKHEATTIVAICNGCKSTKRMSHGDWATLAELGQCSNLPVRL